MIISSVLEYPGGRNGNDHLRLIENENEAYFLILIVSCSFVTLGVSQSVDSLTIVSTGLPVVFKNDTLFYVHSKIGPYRPIDR